jgi:hypothetical protein
MVPLFRRAHLALTPDVSTLQRKNLRLLIKSAYDNINSFEYPLKSCSDPATIFSSRATSTGRCSQFVTYSEERGEPLIVSGEHL